MENKENFDAIIAYSKAFRAPEDPDRLPEPWLLDVGHPRNRTHRYRCPDCGEKWRTEDVLLFTSPWAMALRESKEWEDMSRCPYCGEKAKNNRYTFPSLMKKMQTPFITKGDLLALALRGNYSRWSCGCKGAKSNWMCVEVRSDGMMDWPNLCPQCGLFCRPIRGRRPNEEGPEEETETDDRNLPIAAEAL